MVRTILLVLTVWLAAVPHRAAAQTAPDSIAGVLALLDSDRPDPQRVAKLRQVLDAPIGSMDQTAQAQQLWDQGKAALALGLTARCLDSLHKAVRLAPGHLAANELSRLFTDLAIAESSAGNLKATAAAWQSAIAAQDSVREQRGRLFSAMAGAVNALSVLGDITVAHGLLERMRGLLAESRTWRHGEAFAVNGEHWQAQTGRAEGFYLMATGAWPEAEAAFRRGLSHIQESATALAEDDPEQTSGPAAIRIKIMSGLAHALAQQGRLAEAETVALKALAEQVRRFGRETPQTALALLQLGSIALARSRFDEADRLIRLTVALYDRLGHGPESRNRDRAHQNLAVLQVLTGKLNEADATFSALAREMSGQPELAFAVLGRDLTYPYLLIRRGRAAEALSFLEQAQDERRRLFGDNHPEFARALGLAALARTAKGDRAGAVSAFRQAAPVLITESLATDGDTVSAQRDLLLHAILEGAISALVEAGQGEEAFRYAEAARGHRVQRAMAAAAARSAAGSPELAAMVRSEQDAAFALAGLRNQLATQLVQPAAERDRSLIARLESEITQAESGRGERRSALARRFPGYAGLINPRPVSAAEVLAVLQPDEAMVSVLVGEDRSWVWSLRPGRPVTVATVAMGNRALTSAVVQIRAGLNLGAATLPPFDLAGAGRLYTAFLAPLSATWKGAVNLLVVPDKALAGLPFALLPTGNPARSGGGAADYQSVPWLIRDAAITHVPSATVLVALRHLPGAGAGRKPFLAFADPVFNHDQLKDGGASTRSAAKSRGLHVRAQPSRSTVRIGDLSRVLPPLPETADEVRGVAQALGADPARDVLLGRNVTVARVRSMPLSDRRILMFATHGLMAGEIADLPQPALALSVPAAIGESGAALLTLDDILGLKLDADLVVLSACNTAAPEGGETDNAEAVSGLGRAFFQAGSRAMLVTHWAVETESAAALTTGMFSRLATGLPRSEALRQSMLAVMDRTDTPLGAHGYAHPGFWAPYAMIGDGSGR